MNYSKTCLKRSLKIDKTKVLKVESIAECTIIGFEIQFLVLFLSGRKAGF